METLIPSGAPGDHFNGIHEVTGSIPVSSTNSDNDLGTSEHHKVYYPGAHRLHIRVTGDLRTGRLLGAQIVGHWQAEVAKRIDIFATALFHAMAVDGILDLDLGYTPPMGAPWDAVQEAAQAWLAARP